MYCAIWWLYYGIWHNFFQRMYVTKSQDIIVSVKFEASDWLEEIMILVRVSQVWFLLESFLFTFYKNINGGIGLHTSLAAPVLQSSIFCDYCWCTVFIFYMILKISIFILMIVARHTMIYIFSKKVLKHVKYMLLNVSVLDFTWKSKNIVKLLYTFLQENILAYFYMPKGRVMLCPWLFVHSLAISVSALYLLN